MRRFFTYALTLLFVVGLLVFPASAQEQTAPYPLTVFAASSLTDAFGELAQQFQESHPDVEVTLNFASSSVLATQLSEGAPADVFASANEKQMQVAIDAGRIQEPAQIFARNQLVIAIPADNPGQIESLDDLANPGILLVLAAPEVPVRTYTDQVMAALAADPAYGDAYVAAVLQNVVSEEANVRRVVAKIALGEADAGIVYSSDITPDVAGSVMTIPIPDAINPVAQYPIAITSDSAQAEQAQAFVDFVLSDEGQAILVHWGFLPRCPAADMTPEATAQPEATETPSPEATPETSGC